MAITPIANYLSTRNNSIAFNGKNRNFEQPVDYDNRSSQSSAMSGLRKVPVIVLMAMSPLTVPNTEAKEINAEEPIAMEVASPQRVEPRIIGNLDLFHARIGKLNSKIYFGKVDLDGDANSIEAISFRYEHDVPNTPNILRLDGMVKHICPKPINSEGEYFMSYTSIDENGKEFVRGCRVPAKYGKYIVDLINSPAGKHMTMKKMPLIYFRKQFGDKIVDGKYYIAGEANLRIDPGRNPVYTLRPHDYFPHAENPDWYTR